MNFFRQNPVLNGEEEVSAPQVDIKPFNSLSLGRFQGLKRAASWREFQGKAQD